MPLGVYTLWERADVRDRRKQPDTLRALTLTLSYLSHHHPQLFCPYSLRLLPLPEGEGKEVRQRESA